MARKRQELTRAQERKLLDLMASGGTLDENTAALKARGVSISRATVARRMGELKGSGKVKATRAKKRAARGSVPPPVEAALDEVASLPTDAEAIPENVDEKTLDRWLATADRIGRDAELDDDFDTVAKMGRLSASLLEHKRKAKGPPPRDQNEDPDYVELGARVAAKLHEYVDKIAKLTGVGG